MGFTMDGTEFITGWICLLMTIFSLSTLSYDEYDNSMPFLMSLPVLAKTYAIEKYLFGLICGLIGLLFAVAVESILIIGRHMPVNINEELISLLIYIPLIMIVLSFSLPVELKLGAEKGRMYMFLIGGIVIVGVIVALKFLPVKTGIIEVLNNINIIVLGSIIAGVAVILFVISMLISVRIVRRKEF